MSSANPASRVHRNAAGFSLLEVILALSILVGAIAVLGELVRLGTMNAASARDLTQAQLLCESKLAEVMSGLIVPEAVQGVPCETDSSWLYSIDVQPIDMPGIVVLSVTVTQDVPANLRPAEFTLVRWVQDPALVLADEVPTEEGSTTGSSTTSGSPQGTGAPQ
jgi:Tfp pilus assembly protein PilV